MPEQYSTVSQYGGTDGGGGGTYPQKVSLGDQGATFVTLEDV